MTGLKGVLGAVVLVLVAGTPVDCQGQELRLTTPAAVEVGDILRIKASSPGDSTTVTFEVKGANGATVSAKLNQSLSQQAFDPQTKRLLVETVDYNRALTLSYTITPTTPPASPVTRSLEFYVDSIGPILKNPAVDIYPSGAVDLTLEFADVDVNPASVIAGNFALSEDVPPGSGNTGKRPIVLDSEPQLFRQNRFVKLSYPRLAPGSYSLTVTGIADRTQNIITSTSESGKPPLSITIPSGNLRGQQPEYPRFLAEGDRPSELNPGDRVDTRVVQLYYLRDARQVAELINRNIQDLNAFSYDAAQRAAADARKRAEDAIDNRRFQDERAVEAARKTRDTEQRLEEAQDELKEVQRDQAALAQTKAELEAEAYRMMGKEPKDINAEITNIIGTVGTNRTDISRLNAEINDAKTRLDKLQNDANGNPNAGQANDISSTRQQIANLEAQRDVKMTETTNLINKANALRTLKGNLDAVGVAESSLTERATSLKNELKTERLPSELTQRQQAEIAERQKVTEAEATELRASQEQFRREVAAGMADRNSYARGKLDSIDPVAQVSISVVGTSRLQLRGPIKGLNKICRMIHQLDSPVGQVKIGIHTIQVNGEHGDRMDVVYERINREVAHSRFLVNASGQLLRRAVQEVADEVAIEADAGILPPNCPPELQVGVVRLNGSIQTSQEQRDRRYLYAFYGSDFIGELEEMDSELLNTDNKLLSLHSMDTISLPGAMFVLAHADHPVRHRVLMRFQELIAGDLPLREMEFIRSLTQLDSCGKPLKYNPKRAQKIDDREARAIMFNNGRTYTFPNTVGFFSNQIQSQGTLNPVQYATVKLAQALKAQLVAEMEYRNLLIEQSLLRESDKALRDDYIQKQQQAREALARERDLSARAAKVLEDTVDAFSRFPADSNQASKAENLKRRLTGIDKSELARVVFGAVSEHAGENDQIFAGRVSLELSHFLKTDEFQEYLNGAFIDQSKWLGMLREETEIKTELAKIEQTRTELTKTAAKITSRQVFEQFLEDQEEKSVELMEALRANSSNVDNYLKRLAIAVEDDVAAQFYEPAFQRIRRVSRTWDVTLGQVETTTVLTNNRTLAKVSPSASFEFDLPKRQILIKEAMQGSKALAVEYGNLLKDPTFVAGSELLQSRSPSGIVGQNSAYATILGTDDAPEFGAELDKLIEPPAVYKFETGTGFEIRPVIQPDGHSVVYTFDYEYGTNIREPVRADEKHLGRVKRHFVHTEVQTSSFELREISRYTVALKAARTDRGIPLFEDIPVLGYAFRPLPSDESSLQTNIILGSSTIYPTVFDIMGLRWSPYLDGQGQSSLREAKHEAFDRRDNLRTRLLQRTRQQVDQAVDSFSNPDE